MIVWGGVEAGFVVHGTGARFEPATSAWTPTPALGAPAARAGHVAVWSGTEMVVWGGTDNLTLLASGARYDPVGDSWSAVPPLPQARAGLAAVTLGGSIYALGGESTPGGVRAAVTRLDALDGSWAALPDMPYAAHGLAAVVAGDAILVMGGFTGTSDAVGTESRQCWRYRPPA